MLAFSVTQYTSRSTYFALGMIHRTQCEHFSLCAQLPTACTAVDYGLWAQPHWTAGYLSAQHSIIFMCSPCWLTAEMQSLLIRNTVIRKFALSLRAYFNVGSEEIDLWVECLKWSSWPSSPFEVMKTSKCNVTTAPALISLI